MPLIDDYLQQRYNGEEAFELYLSYRRGEGTRNAAIFALVPLVERFMASKRSHLQKADRDDVRAELLAFVARCVDTMQVQFTDHRTFTSHLWVRFVQTAQQWKKRFYDKHYPEPWGERDERFDANPSAEWITERGFAEAEQEVDAELFPRRVAHSAKSTLRFSGDVGDVCFHMLDRLGDGKAIMPSDYEGVVGDRSYFLRAYCMVHYRVTELALKKGLQIGDMIEYLDQGIMYLYQIFEPYTLIPELLGWLCMDDREQGEDMFLDFLKLFGGSKIVLHGFEFQVPTFEEFMRNVEDVDIYLTMKKNPRDADAVDRLAIRFKDTPQSIRERYTAIALKFNRTINELPHAPTKNQS